MEPIIVIPTYNEKENIGPLIKAVFKEIPGCRVMVVDDNSPDKTAEEVKGLQYDFSNLILFERPGKEGLGRAYIAAFRKIIAEFPDAGCVITMDADFSHDPAYLKDMVKLASDHDLVIGSRYIKGGGTTGWELRRRLLSWGGNVYCRSITGMPAHDCTGGFNCFGMEWLKKLDLEKLLSYTGYAFEMAFKYNLWRRGAKIKELPIIFKNRTAGRSKISNQIIKEGFLTPWRLIFSRW